MRHSSRGLMSNFDLLSFNHNAGCVLADHGFEDNLHMLTNILDWGMSQPALPHWICDELMVTSRTIDLIRHSASTTMTQ